MSTVTVRTLATIAPAKPLDKEGCEQAETVWLLGLEHIAKDSGEIETKTRITPDRIPNSSFGFDDRHVLYSKLRPNLNKVVVPNEPGFATTELVPLCPDPEICDRNYLAAYLRSPRFVNWAVRKTAGAKMPRLSMSELWGHKLPVPDDIEQQRYIATILNKADDIRRKRRKAVELADEFLRSVFLDMFGDPITNPLQWPMKKFGDQSIGQLVRGKSRHRPRNAPELLGGPYPLIQTGDVANSNGYIKAWAQTYSELGLKQSRMWKEGTLCITIAANIAKTGILRFDACFPDSVVGFMAGEDVTAEYVQHWLSFLQRALEAQAPESAQKNINLRILRDLEIPVPDHNLVESFSEIVGKVEKMRERFAAATDDAGALASSISDDFFNMAASNQRNNSVTTD